MQIITLSTQTLLPKSQKNLTFAEAASLPLASITAWDCIVEKTQLRVGETVNQIKPKPNVQNNTALKTKSKMKKQTCTDNNFEFSIPLNFNFKI